MILAITLGVLGTASAAFAGARAQDDDESGGFIIPGSTDGLNPLFNRDYFGSPPNCACFAPFSTYDVVAETYLGTDGRRHGAGGDDRRAYK
jgi:hypothetical protein